MNETFCKFIKIWKRCAGLFFCPRFFAGVIKDIIFATVFKREERRFHIAAGEIFKTVVMRSSYMFSVE